MWQLLIFDFVHEFNCSEISLVLEFVNFRFNKKRICFFIITLRLNLDVFMRSYLCLFFLLFLIILGYF